MTIPVLMEITRLGQTKVAAEAAIKLLLELQRHRMLWSKFEQQSLAEITQRCQQEIYDYLQEGLGNFSQNTAEHAGKILRSELNVAIFHSLNKEKILE